MERVWGNKKSWSVVGEIRVLESVWGNKRVVDRVWGNKRVLERVWGITYKKEFAMELELENSIR